MQAELQQLAGPKIEVKPDPNYIGVPTPASPLRPDVLKAVTAAVAALPRAGDARLSDDVDRRERRFVLPRQGQSRFTMSTAAGRISPDDERAHGLDERLPVRAMYDDVLHWEMVIRALAG